MRGTYYSLRVGREGYCYDHTPRWGLELYSAVEPAGVSRWGIINAED